MDIGRFEELLPQETALQESARMHIERVEKEQFRIRALETLEGRVPLPPQTSYSWNKLRGSMLKPATVDIDMILEKWWKARENRFFADLR